MPRNASGDYQLPAGNPVVPNTIIESNWANPTMSDIAQALTDSLSRSGLGGMLVPFGIADGTLGAPGLAFTNDPTNGLYRSGPNAWSLVAGGFAVVNLTPSSVTIPGGVTFNITDAFTVGAFSVGQQTPATITANQNNYAPAGYSIASMLRISADASRTITGLAGGTIGRLLWLHNIGTFPITFTDEDLASFAQNRFAFLGNTILNPDQVMELQYDSLSQRWRTTSNTALGTISSGQATPTILAVNTNDYAPGELATASMLRISSSANINVTGLVGGTAGRLLWLHNVGAFTITLTDEDPASLVQNRFAFLSNVGLAPDAMVEIQYDSLSQRWRTTTAQNYTDGFRNKIIGGDFSTNPWQRGISFGPMASGSYMADRWQFINGSTATLFSSRQTFSPSIAQAGRLVTNSLLVVPTIVDPTIGANEIVGIQQAIEGYNWVGLAQRPCVLSFWHAHTKTGIYCVAFRNGANDRSFVAEYTQSASSVWEKSIIVISPSPAAGGWNYTNGAGLFAFFTIMCGANFQTTPGIWQTNQFFATANQINGVDSTANNFYLALIQFEAGVVATPFESRSVEQELEMCQRYYEKSYSITDTPGFNGAAGVWASNFATVGGPSILNSGQISFKTRKRIGTMTITPYLQNATNGTGSWSFIGNSGVTTNRTVTVINPGEIGFQLQATAGGDLWAYGHWTADAEL